MHQMKMFHMCWALSDGSPQLIPIDAQPHPQLVPRCRLRKAHGATHEPLHPRPELDGRARDLLRRLLAHGGLLGSEMPCVGAPAVRGTRRAATGLQERWELAADGVLAASEPLRQPLPGGVSHGVPACHLDRLGRHGRQPVRRPRWPCRRCFCRAVRTVGGLPGSTRGLSQATGVHRHGDARWRDGGGVTGVASLRQARAPGAYRLVATRAWRAWAGLPRSDAIGPWAVRAMQDWPTHASTQGAEGWLGVSYTRRE
jgi:hypothetical protein